MRRRRRSRAASEGPGPWLSRLWVPEGPELVAPGRRCDPGPTSAAVPLAVAAWWLCKLVVEAAAPRPGLDPLDWGRDREECRWDVVEGSSLEAPRGGAGDVDGRPSPALAAPALPPTEAWKG